MIDPRNQHLLQLILSTMGVTVLLMAIASQETLRAPDSRVTASNSPVDPAEVSPPETTASAKVVTPPTTPQPVSPPAEQPAPVSRDEELRSLLVGYWNHVENGQQWIENRADGTSRMLLKLDFVASLLYGSESSMQLTWQVQDGVLTHTVLEGTPKKNVDAIVRDYGKVRTYTILESTEERMLLEAHDSSKTRELWTRVPPPKEWQQ